MDLASQPREFLQVSHVVICDRERVDASGSAFSPVKHVIDDPGRRPIGGYDNYDTSKVAFSEAILFDVGRFPGLQKIILTARDAATWKVLLSRAGVGGRQLTKAAIHSLDRMDDAGKLLLMAKSPSPLKSSNGYVWEHLEYKTLRTGTQSSFQLYFFDY